MTIVGSFQEKRRLKNESSKSKRATILMCMVKPGSPLNHVSLDFLYQPSPSSAMAPAAAASTASSTVTPVGNGGGGTNQSSVSSANAKTATTLTPKSATPM